MKSARRKRLHELCPEFVEEIPASPEPGKLYVACRYRAVIHLCACGCGAKISTPLHPTGWRISFDGDTVSLHPSVGNWSEKCQSHYHIRDNQVLWGGRISRSRVRDIRRQRDWELDRYYNLKEDGTPPSPSPQEKLRFRNLVRKIFRR